MDRTSSTTPRPPCPAVEQDSHQFTDHMFSATTSPTWCRRSTRRGAGHDRRGTSKVATAAAPPSAREPCGQRHHRRPVGIEDAEARTRGTPRGTPATEGLALRPRCRDTPSRVRRGIGRRRSSAPRASAAGSSLCWKRFRCSARSPTASSSARADQPRDHRSARRLVGQAAGTARRRAPPRDRRRVTGPRLRLRAAGAASTRSPPPASPHAWSSATRRASLGRERPDQRLAAAPAAPDGDPTHPPTQPRRRARRQRPFAAFPDATGRLVAVPPRPVRERAAGTSPRPDRRHLGEALARSTHVLRANTGCRCTRTAWPSPASSSTSSTPGRCR